MPNPYFSFKQFTVYHHLCAMKVGIDGVLLGAWADVTSAKSILDVGTGSGLIALMLAQRSNAGITAIDIEPNAVLQAEENVGLSPWKDRVKVLEVSLQDFSVPEDEKFDLIVSNPPYFVNSLKNPDAVRLSARHVTDLTHDVLLVKSLQLLKKTGRICLILPVNEAESLIRFSLSTDIRCLKKVFVVPKPNAEPKRMLLEFRYDNVKCEISQIQIETENRHEYTPEFTALAKDFYLKL